MLSMTGVKLPGHRDGKPGQSEVTGTPGRDNGTACEVTGTGKRESV